MKSMHRLGRWIFSICSIVALATGFAPVASGSAVAKFHRHWKIELQPTRLENGSIFVISVFPPSKIETLTGEWLTHEIVFSSSSDRLSWYAIAGAGLTTPPGAFRLRLTGELKNGSRISFDQSVRIYRASYSHVSLAVAQKFTEPSPADLATIQQDKIVKQEVFGRFTPRREWSGDFRPPVEAAVSGEFGTTRTFNGKVQSTHEGLDYAVSTGTRVMSLNGGTVALARPMFFEGNCVMIDHGQGLLTLYLHLSQIEVKEGERVSTGQQIGLSGGTGRATGPHLHLAVRWQGVYLNPAALLALHLP